MFPIYADHLSYSTSLPWYATEKQEARTETSTKPEGDKSPVPGTYESCELTALACTILDKAIPEDPVVATDLREKTGAGVLECSLTPLIYVDIKSRWTSGEILFLRFIAMDEPSLSYVENLTGQVRKTEEFASRSGGDSEVFCGVLTAPHKQAGKPVAIKVLRGGSLPGDIKRIKESLKCELRVWYDLDHDNILPLFGYTTDVARSPALVSPFCEQGHVMEYLEKHPGADLAQMIFQIAKGLEFLHSRKIIHMDLKPHNVLVNDEGRPLICDFGRSKILEGKSFTASTVAGTIRYMAPELISSGSEDSDLDPLVSEKTDVYAFGMVGLEILSGKTPFHDTKSDFTTVWKIREGFSIKGYACPTEYADTWRVITPCAKINPRDRPEMVELVRDLPQGRRG